MFGVKLKKIKKKKLTKEDKLERRKAQKRIYMQKRRQKMTEAELEERRRKDREKYRRKGTVDIKKETPEMQQIIRKRWRECARKYRDRIRQKKKELGDRPGRIS